MRLTVHALISLVVLPPLLAEAGPPPDLPPALKHREGAEQVGIAQDELSADVQQLVIEQTHPKVIELLGEVENIMDEATERLLEADTGGATIATQTEVIEKIHAAAKEKQRQSGGKSGGAMLDMMQRMMGQSVPGDPSGAQQGKPGASAGQGQEGGSDTPNDAGQGDPDGGNAARRIPKSSGTAGTAVPEEYRKALDAYNRGAEALVK